MLEFYPNASSLPHQQGLMHQTDHPLHHHHHHHHHHQQQQQPSDPASQLQTPLQHHQSSQHPHHSTPEMLANPLSCDSSPSANGRTDVVGNIKCEKNYELCEGCGQKIHERFLMRVGEASWHEHCLACGMCGVPLNNSCYVRNGKLYCKSDYDRLFTIKCSRCGDRVHPSDMVMRAQSFIFHLPCFVCCVCCQPLQKGEQFVLRSGQLFCRHDFEKDLYLSAQQQQQLPSQQQQQQQQLLGGVGVGVGGLIDDDMMLDGDSMRPRDGRRGPKRPRTILTSAQRRQFKASFEQSPKPCRKVREALAKDTGLSVRVVQVWFQNQRAKMKKIQRKSKQSGGAGTGEDKNGDKDGGKDGAEKRIKQESPSSEHGHYLGMDGAFGSSQPLNPNMPFSPDDYPANSNDSFCSSDISMDGSTFDQLDEATSDTLSLQNLDLQHQHPHQHQHHSHTSSDSGIMCSGNGGTNGMLATGQTGNINPIDKLYLMQNSYFSVGEH